ncbi:MAG TPA: phosphatase PAP2 family protein, partial [Gemmatimonadales bacterium]|nr:phosphatase PAP2 family protein [Gemmatimonadales bacterium]
MTERPDSLLPRPREGAMDRRLVVGVLIGTLLCIRFVDRPAATYLQHAAYATPLFQVALHIFPILLTAGACLLVLLLGFGAATLAGWSLRPWMSVVLLASGAAAGGCLVAELLKYIIGRSQVYPAYLVHGLYRFSPFHGRPDFGAFPSATAAVSSAALTVLWISWPRGRPAYGAIVGIILAALLITNAHWVSDLLGGCRIGGMV